MSEKSTCPGPRIIGSIVRRNGIEVGNYSADIKVYVSYLATWQRMGKESVQAELSACHRPVAAFDVGIYVNRLSDSRALFALIRTVHLRQFDSDTGYCPFRDHIRSTIKVTHPLPTHDRHCWSIEEMPNGRDAFGQLQRESG